MDAEELASNENDRRVQTDRFASPRGDIIVGGQAVTGSEAVPGRDFTYKRTYANGPMTGHGVRGHHHRSEGAESGL
ncbi:hypothetical protein ACFYOP_00880 [Streptomyces sp. NPDC006294]|uniref:hypothetical protein n=1 Tax=Streptomyces sp. NPDC006294 TaxID=3364743 RepID=UPI0036C0948F